MIELIIVRSALLRFTRGACVSRSFAETMREWASPKLGWLTFEKRASLPKNATWATYLDTIEGAQEGDFRPQSHSQRIGDILAQVLRLNPFDAVLLRVLIAGLRHPHVRSLLEILTTRGMDLTLLLGVLAGAEEDEAEQRVNASVLLRLGLVNLVANKDGSACISSHWAFGELLARGAASEEAVLSALAGVCQTSALGRADFAHVEDADFLIDLLAGALVERADGINILIHGPPGSGKTEFARVLAAEAGARLRAVGEADEDGEEPNRYERLHALHLAQRVVGVRSREQGGEDTVLLFDEMEDLIGDAMPSSGGWIARRAGSKVFINRLLETNAVPVIWTTNTLGNVDDAIVRRMSFVLKLDTPPRSAALRMLERVARDEGGDARVHGGVADLIDRAPQTATVLRVALRAARLAGADRESERVAGSLVRALRGGALPDANFGLCDLDLYETDRPLNDLFTAMRDGGHADVSLLLSGPPGTGKTALAYHLARALDRPLLVRRASDLLSRWVGETEERIAEAFERARDDGAVLLFDEADSLLFDRASAQSSWERGQVNEMLTWLDRHPLPVVAATNHPGKLDPATLRRFVFKLELRTLGPGKAAKAFEGWFSHKAPASLAALGTLTPGDFAVVARQLRHAPAVCAEDIVKRLAAECAIKPPCVGRIGF
ncbi:aaa ATPase central domain-containing protein [Novosphingobium sp. Rr 2-17]|uniref:ATP-binding protein n=1 Tax=Novosphingobium sp. Rr 2-17 TaxID=555793 RepID=UPI0002698189|nr:ATP-binding protein [Novosphingobium sp. Rr 2-17]EIZ80776.1 aaa ATPase central domain-containing protein [Novosphingobium sp. Rr 2-17]